MTTRRKFLQSSTALAAGAWLSQNKTFAASHIPLGLQLYTVRYLAEANLPSVLQKIRAIGYEEVELYWNVYSHPAMELRSMIRDAGLVAPSGHFDYDGLDGKFDYAKALDLQWIVCPMLPKSQWTSLEGFHKAARQFNEWGARARAQGQRFAFHNHNYEFKDFGGKTGYDVLLAETDPHLVWLEMDCYWIRQAGLNPADMLNKLGGRVKMIHLKDRQPDVPTSQELNEAAEHFMPVGQGTLPWTTILAAAERIGVEHYFVEQDETAVPPLDAVRESYNYLHKLMP
jgi:sugar phosphate isomerase/epimerase